MEGSDKLFVLHSVHAGFSILWYIKAKSFCSKVTCCSGARKETSWRREHINSLWALLNTNKNNSLRSNAVQKTPGATIEPLRHQLNTHLTPEHTFLQSRDKKLNVLASLHEYWWKCKFCSLKYNSGSTKGVHSNIFSPFEPTLGILEKLWLFTEIHYNETIKESNTDMQV